jgi:hypothetical protein
MICDIQQYITLIEKEKGKKVTPRTVIRHINKGLLPSNHIPYHYSVGRGFYVIEVKQ